MKVILTLLALTSACLAATNCKGAAQAGYCCEGSVIRKDDSQSFDPSAFLCCKGANPEVNLANGHTSCTAGTQTPLTAGNKIDSNAGIGGTKTSDSSSSSSTGSSSNSNSNSNSNSDDSSSSSSSSSGAMITSAPLVGAAIAAGGLVLAI